MNELNSNLTAIAAESNAAYVVSHYTETGRRLESSTVNRIPLTRLIEESMDQMGTRMKPYKVPVKRKAKRKANDGSNERRLDIDL